MELGRTQDAVDQQEVLTLQHETTARYRLAAAWDAIDHHDFAAAQKALDAATIIDPADSRVAAYLASVATAQKKPADAAAYLQIALALEEAHDQERGVSLTPTAAPPIVATSQPANRNAAAAAPATIPNPLNGDEASMALLLNIRAAARYADLKQPDKQLAALEWNAAIEKRLTNQALHSTPARAELPNPAGGNPLGIRSVANLVAWSHVYYGHALFDRQRVTDAYEIFSEVANGSRTRDIFEPQGLCYAGMWRLKMAGTDPHKEYRATWLGNAAVMEVLTRDEENVIMSRKQDQTQLARTGMADQRETMQLTQDLMDLTYFDDAQQVASGAYDPKNNPNYKGNDDHGPDDGQSLTPGQHAQQNAAPPHAP